MADRVKGALVTRTNTVQIALLRRYRVNVELLVAARYSRVDLIICFFYHDL